MKKDLKKTIEKKVKEIDNLQDAYLHLTKIYALKKALVQYWLKRIVFENNKIYCLLGSFDDDDNNQVFFIYYNDFTEAELNKVYKFLIKNLDDTIIKYKKKIDSLKESILN